MDLAERLRQIDFKGDEREVYADRERLALSVRRHLDEIGGITLPEIILSVCKTLGEPELFYDHMRRRYFNEDSWELFQRQGICRKNLQEALLICIQENFRERDSDKIVIARNGLRLNNSSMVYYCDERKLEEYFLKRLRELGRITRYEFSVTPSPYEFTLTPSRGDC